MTPAELQFLHRLATKYAGWLEERGFPKLSQDAHAVAYLVAEDIEQLETTGHVSTNPN